MGSTNRAFRWSLAGGMQDIGTLGGSSSDAFDASADGGVVVGSSFTADSKYHAFRWTVTGGMQDLGTLPGGNHSYARSASADGSVVVGFSENASLQRRAFRWTAETGMVDLGTLGGESFGEAVSSDGNVVGGSYVNASGNRRAFRWTAERGMVDLGTLGGAFSRGEGISANGHTLAGNSLDSQGRIRAFIQKSNGSLQNLSTKYASLLVGNSSLVYPWDVSPNSRFIVGQGFYSVAGRTRAFLLDVCPGGDSDNDCLCDDWERNGLDVDDDGAIDLDLPAMGAQVGRKDIFVEYDSMSGFAPSQAALNAVMTAFSARGIGLHFQDGGDQNMTASDWTNPWPAFDARKKQLLGAPDERASSNWVHIREAKELVFRYAIFGQSYARGGSSGLAELPGNDFIVTLGHVSWQNYRAHLPAGINWDDVVAGTVMHELGHTLNLKHGGDNHTHYKPNYHSVMNYLWQMPTPAYLSSWLLDYSGQHFNTLNESSLSEPSGIGGHAGHQVPIGGRNGRLVSEQGPVDWDGNGNANNIGVRFDVNGDGRYDLFFPYDDWAALDCCSGITLLDSGRGVDPNSVAEMDFQSWLDIARVGRPPGDVDLNGCTDDTDLARVLTMFGETGSGLAEDLNNDGSVDDIDLAIVLENFGAGR